MACSGKKTLSAITSGCILKEKGGWVGTSSLFPVKISKLEKDVYNTEKEFYKLVEVRNKEIQKRGAKM
jgi:hypothetical protein